MGAKNFIYIALLLGIFALTVVAEFRKKTGFFSNFKYFIPAMLFSAAIFVTWDLRFEQHSIWTFNSEFLLGINILKLPIEEWLYFILLSFLGVFLYEYAGRRFPDFERPGIFLALSIVLLVFFGILAYISRQKLYPFFTFFLLTVYLGYTIFRNRFKKHFTRFYIAYFILLVPFTIVSGIITALPVIEYNPVQFFGIRLFTIPVENFAFLFLLLIINISIYEYLKERRIY
jgi:lycopene cyclase domain-containing protein